ncbi:hypothetical protein [Kribbella sp. NPDC051620]|uniref:hypothetical protein n=1 Tax=Kribbella sp. NPDC051620 TaxID=3364120 RepID=UPI0037BB3926
MNQTELEQELRATLAEAGDRAQVVHDLGLRAVRPVRRRRTWLASAVAAAAVAAVAVVVAVNASDHGTSEVASSPPSSRPVTIPTSSWKPGDFADQALRSGVLRVTPEGCPYLIPADPRASLKDRTPLVWPAGYTARYAADGKLEILAPNGTAVVHEGDNLAVGGGLYPTSSKFCTFGQSDAFMIMEDLAHPR